MWRSLRNVEKELKKEFWGVVDISFPACKHVK